MKKYNLDKNWHFLESGLVNKLLLNVTDGWQKVSLPHDYGAEKERNPDAQTGPNEGFTQAAGIYYRKEFNVSEKAVNKQFWLEFEAVTGITQVWVNGNLAIKHLNSFTGFWTDVTANIKPGVVNEIRVFTDNRHKPNCRWYTGTGIYGHVWMHIGATVAVKPNSLHITTKKLEDSKAVLAVEANILNNTGKEQKVRIAYIVLDLSKKEVGRKTEQLAIPEKEKTIHTELDVNGITPWSPESPYLYTVRIEVTADTGFLDIAECRTGIRVINVSAKEGFCLNGEPVKLQGGCIHHDLGILGVAGHDAAIRRKIRLLKDNGYNALRFAHNPYIPGYFEACDELGMLVIEEAFDEWVLARTSFGTYQHFEYEWERVVESMINRDYNHPCIIMWSTGNEVEERDGSADGYEWSKRLAEKVRSLDNSRPVSVTACSLPEEYGKRPADGATGNQALNMAFDNFESGEDLWGDRTADFFKPADVAGYNYKTVRYAHDGKKFPGRVIYGSETYPRSAYDNWKATVENNHVIGDFVWTAMDYLGEQGLGRFCIGEGMRPPPPEWPWLTAYCGDLDLIGNKRPQSDYRDAVWQQNNEPHIFVLPPELTGKPLVRMSWTWDPVERNYTYTGNERQKIEVYIYAAADEVELFQNGISLGRNKTTEFKTVYEALYEPGELSAVAYKDGKETGRDVLRTTGKTAGLELSADRNVINADGADLCFVLVRALDENGALVFYENGEVTAALQGGGELLSFGNADPKPDRLKPFKENICPFYHGVALAVIRSDEDSKGCTLEVSLKDGITASLGIAFTAMEPVRDEFVSEVKPGVLDLSLGVLTQNEDTNSVLKRYLPELIANPMLIHMKSMPLRKIISMGGFDPKKNQTIEEALIKARKKELDS